MKKITIILALLFLFVTSINGQKLYRPNTIYMTVQPLDMGIGVRYDRMLNSYPDIEVKINGHKYQQLQTV